MSPQKGNAVIFRRGLLVKCTVALCLIDELYLLPWLTFLTPGRFSLPRDSRIIFCILSEGDSIRSPRSKVKDSKLSHFVPIFFLQEGIISLSFSLEGQKHWDEEAETQAG